MTKFLKPTKFNLGLTALISISPILTEHVLLEDGSVIVEHYSPVQLLVGYAILGEIFAFAMISAFCFFIYFIVSLLNLIVRKLKKVINFKKLTSIT